MTYCLAIKTNSGIVFAADTRTNAGVDYVTAYRKLHVLADLEDRAFVLLTAGNLATSQEVCHWLQRDLEATDGRQSLATVSHPFEAAEYVGRTSRAIQERHGPALSSSGVSGNTSMILGGQIAGRPHGIFLVYPEGNFIEASDDTPYLQIGENKYGKPMLDRLVTPELSLADAARLSLISLEATIRSNVTVGAPIDLAVYRADSLTVDWQMRLDHQTPFYTALRNQWHEGLCRAFENLPHFDWEEPG